MSWNTQYGINPDDVKALVRDFGGRADFPALLASEVVTPYVETSVNTEMQAKLFLDTRTLVPGETTQINVEPLSQAFVVDETGASLPQPIGRKIIDPPNFTADALLIFDLAELAMGVVRPLDQHGQEASDLVRAKVDKACIEAALAAVPAENTIECSGGMLTNLAMSAAISKLEDIDGLELGCIFARSNRILIDMKNFEFNSLSILDDLARLGVIKTFGNGKVVKTPRIPANEILLTPTRMVGRCSIVYGPTVVPHYGVEPGKIGMYVRMICRIGVGLGNRCFRVLITD